MKEWYLMSNSTKPNAIGGYENEAFVDFKADAFNEALGTDLGEEVILYNSDLSQQTVIRGIVQGNVADTYLKSSERIMLFPIGTVQTGMYVFFEDCYWLITGYPGNNGFYEKVTLSLCQYLLRWQNSKGEIIERWVNINSASKYDVGRKKTETIILTSNNYIMLMPDDVETQLLEQKRVFIDRNTTNPTRVFILLRSDEVLYDYRSHGCILSYIVDKDELRIGADNTELMLCDYFNPEEIESDESSETVIAQIPSTGDGHNIAAHISGRTNLKLGYTRTYTVDFSDESGVGVDSSTINYSWNINSDFANSITSQVKDNSIEISVSNKDKSLIGNSFELQVVSNKTILSSVIISIEDVY